MERLTEQAVSLHILRITGIVLLLFCGHINIGLLFRSVPDPSTGYHRAIQLSGKAGARELAWRRIVELIYTFMLFFLFTSLTPR